MYLKSKECKNETGDYHQGHLARDCYWPTPTGGGVVKTQHEILHIGRTLVHTDCQWCREGAT